MKNLFLLIICFVFIAETNAQLLPSRTELLLNGTWKFTPEGEKQSEITVPDYWDADPVFKHVKQAEYERSVTIPATTVWQNKTLKLEFEGVNFIADVFVNNKKVGSHIGAWIPFTIDISKYVNAGETFSLKVKVKGGCFEPVIDKNGSPQWPVGFAGHEQRWGIVFDVWLKAFGQTHTQDAFIQTSYRNKTIKVDYSLSNNSNKEQQLSIHGNIFPEFSLQNSTLTFNSEIITLKPGEIKVISVEKEWSDPNLWSPANPYLYYLETVLVDELGNELDKELRRFGFREIWTEGNKLMFNGHPFTILGANIVQHSEFHSTQRYHYMMPENWHTTIDRLFELNLRTVRFHMQPAPKFILDMADERGLLVMDESTVYAREYVLESNKEEYLKNSKKWIEPWVKARRNHPSVIIWNAVNEMGVGWLNWMTSEEMKSLGDEIRKYDTTRPVNYDGDEDVGDEMVNYHYIETYKNSMDSTFNADSSIYTWADMVFDDKPTGVGEFITHYGDKGANNQWWMGTWVRGMRYTNFADIRPYRHDWALLRNDITPQIKNLINSLSQVAVFDLEYDNLGLEPLLNKNYPLLKPGDIITRRLVLYNDAFEDTLISVEVVLKSSDYYQALYNYNGDRTAKQEIVGSGSKMYNVALGTHVDINYTFKVPEVQEWFVDYFDVEFIARKKGEVKFRETIRFQIRNRAGNENKNKPSQIIILSEPMQSKY